MAVFRVVVCQSGGVTDAPRQSPPQLGLLVVHGIGEQAQGSTLVQWSDALADWLRVWSADEPGTALHLPAGTERRVSVERAELAPAEGPAHATLRFDIPDADDPSQTWVVAEGWWAGAFQAPSFGELWSWSFVSVPATAAMHTNAMVGRAVAQVRRSHTPLERAVNATRLAGLVALLTALVLVSPAVIVLFTALLAVGFVAQLLPFPAVGAFVSRAQLAAIGTIGDSQRLVESPTQAGAIKAPIIDGLAHLVERGCTRIAILAHSQGAAVTHKALADLQHRLEPDQPPPVDALITVGSGLPKVHALEHLSRSGGWRNLRVASLAVPICAVTIALCWWYLNERGLYGGLLGMAAIAAVTVVWARSSARRRREALADHVAGRRSSPPHEWTAPIDLAGTPIPRIPIVVSVLAAFVWGVIASHGMAAFGIYLAGLTGLAAIVLISVGRIPPIGNDIDRMADHWLDLYARRDPVPAGPTRTERVGWPRSLPITNRASVVRDHTGYHRNADECLTHVGIELLDLVDAPIPTEAARLHTSVYGLERRWRAVWARIVNLVLGLAALVFALRTWGRADTVVADAYGGLVDGEGPLTRFLPGSVPGFVPDQLDGWWLSATMVVLYAVGAVVLTRIGNGLWSTWDGAAAARELGPERYDPSSTDGRQGALLGMTALLTFLALTPHWSWRTLRSLDLTTWTDSGFVALVVAIPMGVGLVIPGLLVRLGVKDWFLRQDRLRSEDQLTQGHYRMERGELRRAIASYERARSVALATGGPVGPAELGLARALDRLAHERVEAGASDVAETVAAADAAYRRARFAAGNDPDILVAHANMLGSAGPSAEAASLVALAAEVADGTDDGALLAARVALAHDAGAGIIDAELAGLIDRRWDNLAPSEKLAIGFAAAVVVGDPRTPSGRTLDWAGRVRRLLDHGFDGEGLDLRASLAALPGTLPEDDVARLRLLADRVLGRCGDDEPCDPPTPHDHPESS